MEKLKDDGHGTGQQYARKYRDKRYIMIKVQLKNSPLLKLIKKEIEIKSSETSKKIKINKCKALKKLKEIHY